MDDITFSIIIGVKTKIRYVEICRFGILKYIVILKNLLLIKKKKEGHLYENETDLLILSHTMI